MKYFYCYSPNLFKHFKQNGLKFIATGINEKTKRRFWQFESNNTLTYYLEEYRKNKEERKKENF